MLKKLERTLFCYVLSFDTFHAKKGSFKRRKKTWNKVFLENNKSVQIV